MSSTTVHTSGVQAQVVRERFGTFPNEEFEFVVRLTVGGFSFTICEHQLAELSEILPQVRAELLDAMEKHGA